jgi:hypothetical protein
VNVSIWVAAIVVFWLMCAAGVLWLFRHETRI